MKEAIYKKKLNIFLKITLKTVCLMGFKNQIQTYGGRRWQHIAEDVPGSSSSLSGLAQAELSRFPVGSFPSNPQEIEDNV